MVTVMKLAALAWVALVWGLSAFGQQTVNTAVEAQHAPVERRDLAVDVAAELIGEALYLRCFCGEDTLRFDIQGRLQAGEKTKPVDWTLAGMDVQKVTRKDATELELEGVRVAIRYASDRHEFERHAQKAEVMQIFVAVNGDAVSTQRALHAIFSQGIDRPLQKTMPSSWQHYFDGSMTWGADDLAAAAIHNPASPQDAGMIGPKLMRKADANYTAEAARDHIKGTSRVRFVVNTEGAPERITILQPLGYGLDAAAVDAASKFRFSPGLLHGSPVPTYFVLNQEFGAAQ